MLHQLIKSDNYDPSKSTSLKVLETVLSHLKRESMLNPPSMKVPGSVNQVCVTNFNPRDSGTLLSGKTLCVDSTKEGYLYNMNRLIVAGFALYLGKSIWIIKANLLDMLFMGFNNSVIKCELAVYAPVGRNLHTFNCSRETNRTTIRLIWLTISS